MVSSTIYHTQTDENRNGNAFEIDSTHNPAIIDSVNFSAKQYAEYAGF